MFGFGVQEGEGSETGFWVLIALIALFWVFLMWTVMTVIVGIRLSRLCRRAGVPSPGLSYLPILAETRVARLAGANPWLNVLALIPIANVAWFVLTYVWSYRVARPGGTVLWWALSVAGTVLVVALAAIPDLPEGTGYLSLAGLVAIVLGRWMLFDPTIADRLGLGAPADQPPVAAPAETAAPETATTP